jgi:hypothetical protein
MGSKFERLSDEQLNKYMKYFDKIVKNRFADMDDFYQAIMYDDPIRIKIGSPVGVNIGRLDLEYLYYLLENNPEGGPYDDRPQLEEEEVNWVTKERLYVEKTHTGEIETYLSGSLESSYLMTLKNEDEIDPWDWDVTDSDENEGDIIDEWFDI